MKLSYACLLVVAATISVESGNIDPATIATLSKMLSAQTAQNAAQAASVQNAQAQAGAAVAPAASGATVAGQQQQQASLLTNNPTCPCATCASLGATCSSNTDCCAPYTCQPSSNGGCNVCCYTPNCGRDFDGCCSNSDCCPSYQCYTVQVNVTTYGSIPPTLSPFYDSVCLPNSTYQG